MLGWPWWLIAPQEAHMKVKEDSFVVGIVSQGPCCASTI